ncbi:MAG: HEAT repeat domain-containing protein [Pirellulales bacterium]
MKHAVRLKSWPLALAILLSAVAVVDAQPPLSPAEIAKQIAGLSHTDINVRRAAVNWMAAKPDVRYLDALVRALSDSDQFVRQRAAVAIRGTPDPQADRATYAGLKHADPIVRRELLHRFSGRATPEAVRALAARLEDSDYEVRYQAASLLNGIQHDDAVAALRRVLNHSDQRIRLLALMKLESKLAAEFVPALVGRLNDIDNSIRQRAVQLLRRIPDSIADRALMAAMQNADRYVRHQAAEHFGNPAHQQRTPGAVGPLTKLLADLDPTVRDRAATALRVSEDAAAAAAMLGALKHGATEVRRHALQRFHDRPDKKYIDPLVKSLGDIDRANRDLAVRALDRIDDPRAKAAAKKFRVQQQNVDKNPQLDNASTPDKLKLLIVHPQEEVRRRAAETLKGLDGDLAALAAISAFDNPDPRIRGVLIERFRHKPFADAVPVLVKALSDLDQNVRQQAAYALRATPTPAATKAMLDGLKHLDEDIRYRFVEHFRDKNEPKAAAALAGVLNDLNQNVRREAAHALRRIDDEAAVRAAVANFVHPDFEVRNHLIYRFVEKPHPAAFGPLLKILDSSDSRAWSSAAQAVRRYDGEEAATAAYTLLDHRDANVRTQVVARFQEKPHANSVKAFVKGLADFNQSVRNQAASGLQAMPGEEATQAALAALAKVDPPDHQVRYHLVARFIAHPDARAVGRLIEALEDTDNRVRQHAAQAISRSANGSHAKPLAPLLYRKEGGLRQMVAAKFKSFFMDPTIADDAMPSNGELLSHMNLVPPIRCETPKAFVEMIGGDRIVGEVLSYVPKDQLVGGGLPYLQVEPSQLIVLPQHFEQDPTFIARVYTRWIRRIVWKSRGRNRFVPGMAFLQNGTQIQFRSLRWEADAVVVLDQERIKRVLIRDIAELHMPIDDPWTAYYEQLAVLGCHSADMLTRLNFQDGSRVTLCAERFLPFFDCASNEPNDWKHGVRPAWCADGLAAKHLTIVVRSMTTPDQVPLLAPDSRHSSYNGLWPWQANRNVQGGELRCGDGQYEWGFGVHADSVLSFHVPEIATEFRSQFGLDRIAGTRGCARTFVRLRTGDRAVKLYQSPILIGSASPINTGTVKLPKFEGGSKLELVADSAHQDRPSGADPLNIRDMLNWLDPQLGLDAKQLEKYIVESKLRLGSGWFEHSPIIDRRAQVKQLWQGGRTALVSYRVEGRQGIGVLVGQQGHVLTAGHKLSHSGLDVSVQLHDGRSFAGKTLGIYRDADLGLIGIGPQPDLSGLQLSGDGELARTGLFLHITHTEPSAAKQRWFPRVVSITDDGVGIRTFRSQHRPCTIGGAVLNRYGEVVGIHTGPDVNTYAQFCRVYRALQYWDRLTAGEVWGKWLLWSTPRIGIISTGSNQGARVDRVEAGSSAEKVGIKAGDVIFRMDGQPVLSYLEMEPIKGGKDPGDKVDLSVRRGGQTIEMTVELMAR